MKQGVRTILPDSGQRQQFAGGAIRETEGKARVDGISPHALLRLGRLFTQGGLKYGDFRNWEKGLPFSTFIGGIFRHLLAYELGDRSEDHLAAIMWNAQALIHFEEQGRADLDDRPDWARQEVLDHE